MTQYRLIVTDGEYRANSLLGLLIEVLRHRWEHFRRGDGWRD